MSGGGWAVLSYLEIGGGAGGCVEMERLGCSGSWMDVAGWLLRGDES